MKANSARGLDQNSMRINPWVVLIFCMIGVPAAFADEAASKPSFAVNAGVESFRWEEFSGGRRLLSETGPRLVVGFTLDRLLQGTQTNPYSAEARAYLGVGRPLGTLPFVFRQLFLDNRGQTTVSDNIPRKTITAEGDSSCPAVPVWPFPASRGTSSSMVMGSDSLIIIRMPANR